MSNHTTPRSQAQQDASRSNGAKSQGPITDAGKLRSSMNAVKHGLRSSRVVLANESQEKYDHLLATYIAEWNPVGQTESDLLTDMVNARWRIRRIQSNENAAIDTEMFIQRPDLDAAFDLVTPAMRQADAAITLAIDHPSALDYFQRSEARLTRIFKSAKKELIELQTMRLGHRPQLTPQLPVPETTNATNEPTITGNNFVEPETIEWSSLFIPTTTRPTPSRHFWTDAADPVPKDKAA